MIRIHSNRYTEGGTVLKFHLAKIFSIGRVGLFVRKLFFKFIFINTTRFFLINILISSARLKLPKNQAIAKQHAEAELLLFEDY